MDIRNTCSYDEYKRLQKKNTFINDKLINNIYSPPDWSNPTVSPHFEITISTSEENSTSPTTTTNITKTTILDLLQHHNKKKNGIITIQNR